MTGYFGFYKRKNAQSICVQMRWSKGERTTRTRTEVASKTNDLQASEVIETSNELLASQKSDVMVM